MRYTIEPVAVGPLETNCWVYPLPPEGGRRPCAVIDPGDDPEDIIARIGALNLYPRYFLLTHGHFDHIAALPVLAARYPEAEIALHREDGDCLGPRPGTGGPLPGGAALANRMFGFDRDLPPPGRFLAEGDCVGPFRVLHLPGHTPGGIGLYDEAAGVLFSGDILFRGGWGRSDLPGGDSRQLGASLRRLFALDGEVVVCPGHGPCTTVGAERGTPPGAPRPGPGRGR